MVNGPRAFLQSRHHRARKPLSLVRDIARLPQHQRQRRLWQQHLLARMIRTYPDDLADERAKRRAGPVHEMANLAQRELD